MIEHEPTMKDYGFSLSFCLLSFFFSKHLPCLLMELLSFTNVISMQLIYRPDNGEILGVHIFGLHAADLIHEASNAIALGTRIQVCLLCQNQNVNDSLFFPKTHCVS